MDVGRLAQRLSPALVGQRVVVRRALPGGGYGDVLGELVGWRDGVLSVRTRRGVVVEVAEADVAGGKPVPPAPAPRRAAVPPDEPPGSGTAAYDVDDLQLERVAALGWRPLESRWLGMWRLRAGGGFTGRANSVLPLGDPGVGLDAALRVVTAWYAERGLAARFQVPLPALRGLDDALDARGWAAYNPTVVMTAPLATVLERAPLPPHDLPPVVVEPRVDDEWLAAYHYRGGELPAVARAVLEGAGAPGFGRVTDGAGVLAIGRVAVDSGWAGITAVEVVPRARRRGLGTHVLRGLCEWAAERGAAAVYLQVAEENAAARALYARSGFRDHHGYRYRRGPGEPA